MDYKFKINFSFHENKFQKSNHFPNEFSCKFSKYGKNVVASFIKQQNDQKNQSILSKSDIYVIDDKNGQPKLYKFNNENNNTVNNLSIN